MEILNIGPMELLLIIAIAVIVLGPEEMVRTARKLAKTVYKFIHSPIWKSLVDTSQEIRQLPKKFISEAGLDETVDELNKMNKQIKSFTKTNPLDATTKLADTEKMTGEKTEQPENKNSEEQSKLVEKVEQQLPVEMDERVKKQEKPEAQKQEDPLENTPKAGAA